MDEERFDQWIRVLGDGATRRGVLGALAGIAGLGLSDVAAKRRRQGDKRNRKAKERVQATSQDGKVTICHRTGSETNPIRVITVAASALPDHLAHGDLFSCPDGECRECCENGEQSACADGKTCCSGICVDLETDPDNCCQCGRKCGAGEICSHGLTCQDLTCLPVTRTSGDVSCAPNGGVTATTEGDAAFGAIRIDVPAGTLFGDLASMKSDFQYTVGQCGVGSPRFVVFLKNGRCPYAQFPPPLCNFPNAQGSTSELIGDNTPFIWNGELCGGSNSDHTWNQIFALYQNEEIDRIALVVDESGGEETVTLQPCVTIANP